MRRLVLPVGNESDSKLLLHSYYGGDGSCDGLGASCTLDEMQDDPIDSMYSLRFALGADPQCETAYHVYNDDHVIRACGQDDVRTSLSSRNTAMYLMN